MHEPSLVQGVRSERSVPDGRENLGPGQRAGRLGQRTQREVLTGEREAVRQHGVVHPHQVWESTAANARSSRTTTRKPVQWWAP